MDARVLAAVVAVLVGMDLLLIDQNMWVTVPVACLACILLVVIAFGLWHIPAGLRLIGSNEALEDATDGSRWAAAGGVVAIVVFTGLSGVLFAELRRRSGSLLAPAGLHWATNGLGTVVSALR